VQLLPLHSEHLKAVFVGTFIGSLTVACGVSIADHGWRAMVIVAVTSTTSLALCDLLTR